MNIFKTLASGSGSINEPNVSAFLGYLLNPKEDHGLGDAFLKRFLQHLLGNDKLKFMNGGGNLSIHSNFEFEVLLEQAFKDDDDDNNNGKGNQIVDIVILCYKKKPQKGQFLAEEIIKQKKEGGLPEHIFLIENKISDTAVREGQLKEQFDQTINKLTKLEIKDPQGLVSVIFVTPGGKNSIKEFEDLKEADKKIHLLWNKKDDKPSVSEMIREIIENESKPIDAYCKYTLKAFLEFIENGFKSTIIEEKEEKQGKDYSEYNFEDSPYNKARLPRAIIKKYIIDNPNTSLSEMQSIFTKKIHGSKEIVIDASEAKKQEKTLKENNLTHGYYLIKDDELITLENGQQISVLSWWNRENLPNFIKKAEELKYKIEKLD